MCNYFEIILAEWTLEYDLSDIRVHGKNPHFGQDSVKNVKSNDSGPLRVAVTANNAENVNMFLTMVSSFD